LAMVSLYHTLYKFNKWWNDRKFSKLNVLRYKVI
jgi:hypothetical protein